GDVFTLSEIEVNFFSVSIITDADITYYEDDNGLPGSVLNTMTDVTPTAVFDIGSFGIFIWKAIFDVPQFDFVGQAGEETRYWISITVSNMDGDDEVYWETKSVGQQGFQPAINDNGTGWMLVDTSNGQHVEGVYEFIGECSLGINTVAQQNVTVFPNPATDLVQCVNCQDITKATIYNLTGQQMAVLTDLSGEINIGFLLHGMYFFELVGSDIKKTVSLLKI
ncbi:MAG: T9SS type A sorting domain-containing protein, partial [Flavobacteriaceae bacterium]|nr:T9SS type A sorting domain-containing protein [Flavobacteriaceae bacterium]